MTNKKTIALNDPDVIELFQQASELIDEDFDVTQFGGEPVNQEVVEKLCQAYLGYHDMDNNREALA